MLAFVTPVTSCPPLRLHQSLPPSTTSLARRLRRRAAPRATPLQRNTTTASSASSASSSPAAPPDRVPPLVIGLNQYTHDTALAVANAATGQLLFAAPKERLSRRKHDGGDVTDLVPHALSALAAQLAGPSANLARGDVADRVQLVVANNHHFRIAPFERRLQLQALLHYVPASYVSPYNLIGSSVPFIAPARRVAPAAAKVELSHHLAHAFSAAQDAPFRRGVVLVMDGMGDSVDDWLSAGCNDNSMEADYFHELSIPACLCTDHPRFVQFPADVMQRRGVTFREAETAYVFERSESDRADIRLQRVYKRWTPENAPPELMNHSFEEMESVGALYSRVSSVIFRDWNACGKVMGLAPYGRGSALLGKPQNDRYLMHGELSDGSLDVGPGHAVADGSLGRTFADCATDDDNSDGYRARFETLAYQMQHDLEAVVIKFVTWLVATTGEADVAFAGGVALNSCLNGRIADTVAVRTLYVPPYPGDDGIAVGCAAFGTALLRARGDVKAAAATGPEAGRAFGRMPFLGRRYDVEDVEIAIRCFEPWVMVERCDAAAAAAGEIVRGGVVGWFDGPAEFGPRALGARSLLADGREADMRDFLNDVVKRRESFRPFAPVVLADGGDVGVGDLFGGCEGLDATRYMSVTRRVRGTGGGEKDALAVKMGAVTHVDGTARVQVVAPGEVRGLERVLETVHERSGMPFVVNTSFNMAGEPIVETPFDAVRTMLCASGIAMVAFNGEGIVVRRREWSDVRREDVVASACAWVRATAVRGLGGGGGDGGVEVVWRPVLGVERVDDQGEGAEWEERTQIQDGLQWAVLEMVQDVGSCSVADLVDALVEGDGEGEDEGFGNGEGQGPDEGEIVEALLVLFAKMLITHSRCSVPRQYVRHAAAGLSQHQGV